MPAGRLSEYVQALLDRFWCKVDKSGDCWEWTASKDTAGYGSFRLNGILQGAHRVSLMLSGTLIPIGKQVLHHCDNPSCVNPDHLFLGTNAENVRDRNAKGRQAKGGKVASGVLSEKDAIFILKNKGIMTQRKMAKIFGVQHSTIGCIWRRTTWNYLDCQQSMVELT